MADTHRFSVSVAGAVIRGDGKVLVIKRADNGHWEPPGGLVEPGETLHEAVVREIREETGVDVRPLRLSGVYQNTRRDILSLLFVCTAVGGAPAPHEESQEVTWLDPSELAGLMDEAYAVRLYDAVAPSEEVPVRAHDGVTLHS